MVQAVSNPGGFNAAARHLARLLARPAYVAAGCLGLLAAMGWIYLGLMLAGAEFPPPDGRLAGWGRTAWDVLCVPAFGTADVGNAAAAAAVLMWIAMVAAMMLPTAGPMVLTYAEMAEAAAQRGERTASPLALIAGYGLVWAGFAVIAAALQLALTRAALLDPSMASTSTLFSGAVFIAAGVYQFSALKHACVTLCQHPAPFFAAYWADQPRNVFRLGVRQGLSCLGCCFAMMLVMFAVGVMNVIWMAVLGFIMAAEKIAVTTRFSRVIGTVFIGIGIGFAVAAVAAHWPARVG
jgi:predicted metal-binding membrane protein